jgi:stage II sporulation protein D
LRSTAFTVMAQDNTITFYTRGYGHRVGMSQYGADAMASRGSTYDQILAYYYQGTELRRDFR